MRRTVLATIAVVGLVVATRRCGHPVERCRLEQRWEAGDVHHFEGLELRSDASGHWYSGSYDQDVEPQERDITWSSDGQHLTIDGRSVPFDTEDQETYCILHVHEYALEDSHELYWYTRRSP